MGFLKDLLDGENPKANSTILVVIVTLGLLIAIVASYIIKDKVDNILVASLIGLIAASIGVNSISNKSKG